MPEPEPPLPASPSLRDLPPALQAALPPLVLSGTVYAQSRDERMALLNGEVWREGEAPAPGVLVVRIGRKDVELSFQGQRFRISP